MFAYKEKRYWKATDIQHSLGISQHRLGLLCREAKIFDADTPYGHGFLEEDVDRLKPIVEEQAKYIYNIRQVCEYCELSKARLQRLVRSNEVPQPFIIGSSRRWSQEAADEIKQVVAKENAVAAKNGSTWLRPPTKKRKKDTVRRAEVWTNINVHKEDKSILVDLYAKTRLPMNRLLRLAVKDLADKYARGELKI